MESTAPMSFVIRSNYLFLSLLGIFTLLAYSAPFVSPGYVWWLAFVGYSIPFIWMFNLIVLIVIRKQKLLVLVPVIALLAGLFYLPRTLQWSSSNNKNAGMKILSYNCRYFNVGNTPQINKGEGVQNIINQLTRANPDIICFQEFYSNEHTNLANTRTKLISIGFSTYLRANRNISNSNDAGIAIFSKKPLIDKGEIPFPESEDNKALFGDFLIGKDTIRIYNVHFSSLNWKNEDKIIDKIKKQKRAFILRSKEVRIILDHMLESPYPVILAGDFNDLPYSFAYQCFSNYFDNSFEEAGQYFGVSFRGSIPGLRIDNQFSQPGLRILEHKVLHNFQYTDHFPILVTYDLN